jgi:hypothetical protein
LNSDKEIIKSKQSDAEDSGSEQAANDVSRFVFGPVVVDGSTNCQNGDHHQNRNHEVVHPIHLLSHSLLRLIL